ncbi:MAG: 4Fe-4S dicluster domain-containing protein [Deltaproteobacteria bacterium]|jgi:NADH-quinone oxidoreductase subunit F|nr:4Fe-4S dicluster domain-containing protein [Deltaproteobacteria bacterium]
MRFEGPAAVAARREELARKDPDVRTLRVCGGPGCLASGSRELLAALKEAAVASGLDPAKRRISFTGCLGLCERGPLLELDPEGHFLRGVAPSDAAEVVGTALGEGKLVPRLSPNPESPEKESLEFYGPQKRLIMRRFGKIDPESFDDYLATGGYEALVISLFESGPAETLRRVAESGLRGRGGGGFPAGLKWKAMTGAKGTPRYVLANGDEGDPGAFMNRSLMEGDPLAVVEGLTIGAFALGAERGIIYVRNEYPLSVARLEKAIAGARARGLLGENILGTDFSFDLSVTEGGGAFVCGESTALMASIEGREGTPRVKYVRSTEAGLWDKPTVLQNVETWANVPLIAANGPEWFKGIGAKGNPGTKVFSLAGETRNTGLVELPLGTKVGVLVNVVGGGVRKGRRFKAIQSGGPSGGCLPESALELPLDFDHLTEAGAMMGSGGIIVMDDLSCPVDVARYFTGFLAEESCGKCVPCREALPVLREVLSDLTRGSGRKGDTDFLEKQAGLLKETALCGLGQSAANPVLSTIRHFREEYLEHESGYCRSGRCRGLYVPVIDPGACRACGSCQKVCPAGAVGGKKKEKRTVAAGKCVGCGACLKACAFFAIRAERKEHVG